MRLRTAIHQTRLPKKIEPITQTTSVQKPNARRSRDVLCATIQSGGP